MPENGCRVASARHLKAIANASGRYGELLRQFQVAGGSAIAVRIEF
jgi:hypothetical protein